MGLQFVLGTATADHEATLAQHVTTTLADPAATLFYLVPNHVKFEAEVNLLTRLRNQQKSGEPYAQSRLQVLSFTRLAWFYLKNLPIYQQARLDQNSNTMVVAQLLTKLKDDLTIYQGEVGHVGFATQLAEQLNELLTGRIGGADLEAIALSLPETDQTRAKFLDLATIMKAYEETIGPFATNASLLSALDQVLTKQDLSHTYFYFDHFSQFTAIEMQLVKTLMARAKQVTVSLRVDRGYPNRQPVAPNLFLPAANLYHQLYQEAKAQGIPIQTDLKAQPRALSQGMHNVAAWWEQSTDLKPMLPSDPVDNKVIHLAVAADEYTELQTVARQIYQAVRKGARYRDFLVIARHLTPYTPMIDEIFARLEIPQFTDIQRPMKHHPLFAFIDSLFAIYRRNYRYQDVMRLLRTELLVPIDQTLADFRHAVDVTDNHLVRTGINGQKRWRDPEAWRYFQRNVDPDQDQMDPQPEKTALINQVKQLIGGSLPALFHAWEQAGSAQEAASSLYQWLVANGIKNALETRRQTAEAQGDLTQAQAITQAWATFGQLLSDYVAVMGATPFAIDQFYDLLSAGFNSATYTQIPSTLDQVVISETGLVRRDRFKYVYVIGATSTAMPDVPTDQGILNSAEREALVNALPEDQFLPEQGPKTTLGDPFINYLGFLAASQGLTISYPIHASDDTENQVSPYVLQLKEALGLGFEYWNEPRLIDHPEQFVTNPRDTLTSFLRAAQQAAEQNIALGAGWQAVLSGIEATSWRSFATRLVGSLHYDNAVGHLDPKLATQLYVDPNAKEAQMRVSISQLETYYRNPFQYFLKYGLRLQPRPEFELSPADTGSLFHAALDHFFKQLGPDQTIASLSAAERSAMLRAIMTELVAAPQYAILGSSARMAYLTKRLVALLDTDLATMQQQSAKTDYRTVATEVQFGPIGQQKGLAPLIWPLDEGKSVMVRGKLDRIDLFQENAAAPKKFLVVDYKSSHHAFDFVDAYYGIALQMLTYIQALEALKVQPPYEAAGALYFHLQEPRFNYPLTQATAAAEQFEKLRYQGFIVADQVEDTLHLDQEIDAGTRAKSEFLPIKIKKDGSFSNSGQSRLSRQELEAFLRHNEQLIKEAAKAILAGTIDLAPFQYRQEATTITQSDYQAIMLFDPATGHDRYRHLQNLSAKEVLKRLQDEQSKGESPS